MSVNTQEILNDLHTQWLGRRIYYHPVVQSTNDLMKERAEMGEPAGSLLLADYQSKGKGRHGRQWQAPAGSSLLFSLLFRPDWSVEQATWLTMIAGLATIRAIDKQTGLSLGLKPTSIIPRHCLR